MYNNHNDVNRDSIFAISIKEQAILSDKTMYKKVDRVKNDEPSWYYFT